MAFSKNFRRFLFWNLSFIAAVSLILPWAPLMLAQATGANDESTTQILKPGVVIEKFDDDFSAAKNAGMLEGDVLLSWSRGPISGQIESPFDVSLVVNEQFPLGAVVFEGLHGNEKRTWNVVKKYWGTRLRPNFSDAALASYREALKNAEAGEAVTEPWLVPSARPHPTWLSSWFFGEMAGVLAKGQHWQEADDAYQRAIQNSPPGMPSVKAQLLLAWGWQLYHRGDWERAVQCFESATENGRKANALNLTADSLGGLGWVARNRGDLSRAEDYFSQSLAIAQRVEPHTLYMAECLINAGIVQSDRGDLVKAENYYQQALAIFQELAPRSVGTAFALNNLGTIVHLRGDLNKAENYLRQALTLEGEIDPGTSGQATLMRNLANILQDEGDRTASEKYMRDSVALEEKLEPGSTGVAEAYQALGSLLRERGDLSGAEPAYRRVIEISQKLAPTGLTMADALYGVGEVARGHGDLIQAESYQLQALAIREKLAPQSERHADSLAALAEIAKGQGQMEKASSYYELALKALEGQAARLGGAEDDRAAFRALRLRYYREYIDLLVSLHKPELAFAVLERSRARALLKLLTSAQIDIRTGVDLGLIAREHSLQADIKAKSERRIHLLSDKHTKEQINAVEKEIRDLTNEYQDVEEQIRFRSPGYAALTQPEPLDARAVQRLLPEDTLLLEYALGEERSYVFAVTPASLNVYDLPKRAVIEEQAQSLYHLITERTRIVEGETDRERNTRWKKADAESRKAATELSAMILAPLVGELRGRRLLIVSDGALQYVPFAALPLQGLSPHKGPVPLISQHEIVSLPSASVLALLREKHGYRKVDQEVAIFADPVFGLTDSRLQSAQPATLSNTGWPKTVDQSDILKKQTVPETLARSVADVNLDRSGETYLPRLAFTRDEAKAIMEATPPGKSMEALGFNATRELAINGELSRYHVVHFATHALVDNIHPDLSGLVLSLFNQKGEPVDGFLDLEDIYNLDLPADLVVLSACQTALGKEVNGEGIIGLTRGFMYAGSPRVISTLWKVNDFATAKLMAQFYKAMEQDRMTPAQALRQAQLALWKEQGWSAPFYWSGFILQGDWQ